MTDRKASVNHAKLLRADQTEAERRIWNELRDRRLEGLKFKRQQPIGKYIVDFVCLEKKLIIEIDGGQHNESNRDKTRDDWLAGQGFVIKRFWNNEIFQNTNGVMEAIREASTTLP